jgi:hypothetical protein
MNDQVEIRINREVFEKLKRLAEPLVDNTSTVIDRLIRHWQTKPPKQEREAEQKTPEMWRSPRGDILPIGVQLQGRYKGRTFAAVVAKNGIRFEGKIFSTLSSAAVAAKGLTGTKGDAASTNGRDFWALLDTNTNHWIPISALRPHRPVDGERLLAELEQSK